MANNIKLIVGLGNPGREHEGDRHNAGADFVQALAQDYHGNLKIEPKFFGLSGKINIQGQELRLLIPTTYMNRSGQATAAICQFYKIIPEEILVAHDELDIIPGDIRLKKAGGHGGHNGLRDIISSLGNNKNFLRLRIGIGHPGNAKQVSNYVLKSPPSGERNLIEDSINKALTIIHDATNGNLENAMQKLHTK